MLKFEGDLYTISNEIIYKIRSSNIEDVAAEYNIYLNNQQYVIRDISAAIFTCLISMYTYTLRECTSINVENEDYINNVQLKIADTAMKSLIKKGWALPLSIDKSVECLKSKASIAIKVKDKYFLLNLVYKTIDEVSERAYNYFIDENYSHFSIDECNYLIGRRYITYDSDSELKLLVKDIDYINIYIVFSYECNMKCVYCFESKGNQFYRENNLTIDELLIMIEKLTINQKAIITLYGGEPLLDMNKTKISKIIDWAKEKNNIYFRVITNGITIDSYLTKFTQIYNKILEFVITIDGSQAIHDKRRVMRNGKGSFDIIIQSIQSLCDNKIHVCVRVNLDKDNINYQTNFLQYLSDLKINKDLISVAYYRVEDKSNSSYEPISYKECYELYKQLANINDINIRFGDPIVSTVIDVISNNDSYPYIRPNYCGIDKNYIVDCDGNIYCCNESMGIKEFSRDLNSNDIPQVCLLTKKCEKCSLYYVCYGGCYLRKYYLKKKFNYEICEGKQIMDIIQELCYDYSKNTHACIRL